MIKITRLIIRLKLLLPIAFSIAGCAMMSSPTTTSKKLNDALNEGRIDDALKLFSAKMVQKGGGIEEARKALQQDSDARKQAQKNTGKTVHLNNLKESVNGETAQVSYQVSEESQGGAPYLLTFSKQNSAWLIDDIEFKKQLP